MCTKGALNSSTATLEEASNKCYFHAKLFLFCATRLICVRGLFSSVMPRAIFHLTEEAKLQDATATLLQLGIFGLQRTIFHNSTLKPWMFLTQMRLNYEEEVGRNIFFRFNYVQALVTQPMLQRRPNCTELRSMDSYIQILCRFQKCKQKVPPPSPLVMKNRKVFFSKTTWPNEKI